MKTLKEIISEAVPGQGKTIDELSEEIAKDLAQIPHAYARIVGGVIGTLRMNKVLKVEDLEKIVEDTKRFFHK
jgi:hypothetical protein